MITTIPLENHAINKLVEYFNLKLQYGHVSCFDVPEQYDNMDCLLTEAYDLAEQLSLTMPGITPSAISELLRKIAEEIHHGNLPEDCEIVIQSHDDYIDSQVLYDEKNELFESLYYYMDVKQRIDWLTTNHLQDNNDLMHFHTYDCACIVMVYLSE